MPRIRTVKPEFWSSPDTAKASAVARLAYIAMWNWADDYGRGTMNPKELEGFIFPNDDLPTLSGGTSENFRRVLAEVVECFGVDVYSVRGRDYYAIPSWNDHQRTERSAKAKHPGPDEADGPVTCIDVGSAEIVGSSDAPRRKSAESPALEVGTGEVGTGEQSSSSAVADATPRPEVEALCTRLADRIEANGSKRPNITQRWRDATRLMLDRDDRTPEQIAWLVDWCQADEFWRANIQSMPKLREKFDQLRLKAAERRSTPGVQSKTSARLDGAMTLIQQLEAQEGRDPWTAPRQLGS